MAAPAEHASSVIRKRDGRYEDFDRRKVEHFLQSLSWNLDMQFIDLNSVVDNLVQRLPEDAMDSDSFQIFLAEIVSTFSARHPDYSVLAGRVYTSYIHKRVPKRFTTWVLGQGAEFMSKFSSDFLDVVRNHGPALDAAIAHFRDFKFTYRALLTFHRSYLIKTAGEVNERPQFLYMRVAVNIHQANILRVIETYELLSTGMYSHASPTLWNSGLTKEYFASCYIFEGYVADSIDGITHSKELSLLWSSGGGVGISAGEVPATSTNVDPESQPGLLPLLKVYDSLAGYWSRGSPHRSCSAAVYLPIWHSDVRAFVLCRTNRASAKYRFQHLFPGLWVPNVFMRRLEDDLAWSLFDPVRVQSLLDLTGDSFTAAYEAFERAGLATTTLPARTLWETLTEAWRESGTPFVLFADNINARNNQMHRGIIKSSNLCTEIVQYSSVQETAICTLAALCLPRYVRPDGTFDYEDLHRVTGIVVRNLDLLIDRGDFPTPNAAVSAYGTRALGIGVQGLADTFAMLGLPFTSAAARTMNVRIFETIYHAALEGSVQLAREDRPYDTWEGSPASRGVLQVDMWDTVPTDRYDFDSLRTRIVRHGLRNSMLTAQMPTASTAQLLGNSEGIDPYTSNVVQHRLLSGSFNELSRPLVNSLVKRGLWSERVRSDILACNGSIQTVHGVPDDVKAVFRTAFELDPKELIDMSLDRSPYIDQSQSFSLYVAFPTPHLMMDLHLHGWRKGIKTGQYYLRSKSATEAQPFGVAANSLRSPSDVPSPLSPRDNEDVCPCDV